jgi:hypothetical protein
MGRWRYVWEGARKRKRRRGKKQRNAQDTTEIIEYKKKTVDKELEEDTEYESGTSVLNHTET